VNPVPRIVSDVDVLAAAVGHQEESVLAGNAGTGKTTLVRALLERLDPNRVLLLAPTAKAALRLREVSGRPASTVHSLLYGAPAERWVGPEGTCWGRTLPDGTVVKPPCRAVCPDCTCRQELVWGETAELAAGMLLVVDEASMIGAGLASDLRLEAARQACRILWVGDPGQLPPVSEAPGVDLGAADVHLRTVHRSDRVGILRLSQEVRAAETGAQLTAALRRARQGGYEGVVAGPTGWPSVARWRAGSPARMLIVHRNRDRQLCNELVRRVLGRAGPLQEGDRILIRKNIRGFVHNGEVHVVTADEAVEASAEDLALPDGATLCRVTAVHGAVTRHFVVRADLLDTVDNDAFEREREISKRAVSELALGEKLVNAQYGYALTCHAAQGSEAPEVGVAWTDADVAAAEHPHRFEYMRSWLYTAVTRARQQLTVWVGP
jgi:exodeoxyribonuclease-5